MNRIFILLVIVFQFTVEGQIHKMTAAQYYSVYDKDTFYFFLSNEKLIELSSSGNSTFYYVDEIPGPFNAATKFAVNNNQLVLLNRDTIHVYSRNLSGKLIYGYSQADIWDITTIDPWNNDFIITSGGIFKVLSCLQDFAFIKDDSLLVNSGYQVSYPYLVKSRDIYKYLEGFGAYQVYYIFPGTDPGLSYWLVEDGQVIYHTYSQIYPTHPPEECSLKSRLLQEPDFPYLFNYIYWGINDPMAFVTLSSFSSKYLVFKQLYNSDRVYDHYSNLLIEYEEPTWCYAANEYLFKYDTSVTFTTRDFIPLLFLTLEYIITDVDDNNNSLFTFDIPQNYPNPFNTSTFINFNLSSNYFVNIKVYNALGKEITELVNESKSAGEYQIKFDASDLSSGIYFYTFTLSNNNIYRTYIKKCVLIK